MTKTEILTETARASVSSKCRQAEALCNSFYRIISLGMYVCRMNKARKETGVETGRKEIKVPNKLRLRRGGGGGVGGCGVFAPRREISTSTRETVSPEARVAEKKRKKGKGR